MDARTCHTCTHNKGSLGSSGGKCNSCFFTDDRPNYSPIQLRLFGPDISAQNVDNLNLTAIDTQIGGGHYKDMPIQPIEYCIANQIPFAEGNVIKYVSRWRKKGGVQDLKKARHMLDMLIEAEDTQN